MLNHAIRKITPAGVVTTVAGGTSGFEDGMGRAAQFYHPNAITIDSSNNLYVTNGNVIRKITPAGVVSTIAGNSEEAEGFVDGTGAAARFRAPSGITADAAGNLYVADELNYAVRKITPTGVVTTLVGQTRTQGFLPSNLPGVLSYSLNDVLVVGNILYISQGSGIAKVTLF